MIRCFQTTVVQRYLVVMRDYQTRVALTCSGRAERGRRLG